MADIGRFDLAHGVKQLLDLTGSFEPEIGEGIVPTVQLANLNETPFSVALPWSRTIATGPTAAQFSWVTVQAGASLPRNSWIEVEQVIIGTLTAAGGVTYIEPMATADIPALAGGGTANAICNRQNQFIRREIPEVAIIYGTSVTGPTGLGLELSQINQLSLIVPGRWAISHDGGIAVIASAVNRDIRISFAGRIHYTTSR